MATNNKWLYVTDFTQKNENMLGADISLNAQMAVHKPISRKYTGNGWDSCKLGLNNVCIRVIRVYVHVCVSSTNWFLWQ